jgi:hypothetical protein
MKYMLLIMGNRQEWEHLAAWSDDEVQAMIQYMDAINEELVEAGELVEARGLAGPDQIKTVRAQPDSDDPIVTDGPFAESKEVLAGYWVVDVPTEQRAIEIATRASLAPGRGGVPVYQPIVVHAVASAPEG